MKSGKHANSVSAAPAPARTAWFDAAAVPARPGVYERRPPAGSFACWDGHAWRSDAGSAVAAALQRGTSAVRSAPWRGLVVAPSLPCSTCRGHTVVDLGVDAERGVDLIGECPDC